VSRFDRPCPECGAEVNRRERPRALYCSDACRYRARDRDRYAADPEAAREKSRRYYHANRERVIARVRARQKAKEAGDVD
jgi:endogenous inhibitor of DNA gyrase (YacG/DUF329 family)